MSAKGALRCSGWNEKSYFVDVYVFEFGMFKVFPTAENLCLSVDLKFLKSKDFSALKTDTCSGVPSWR